MTITPTARALAAPAQTGTAPTAQSSLGQDAFMRLLLTQMQHQDPTAPRADTEFLAQLAQFSTLEQLQQMNQKLDAIAEVFSRLRATAAGALQGNDSSTTQSDEGSQ